MRRITQGDQEKKSAAANPTAKAKDGACRNCGKKGHGHKECKGEICCFYCKEKGHRRFDCPLLKRKDARKQNHPATSAVAAEVTEEHPPEEVVAFAQENSRQLVVDSPLVQIDSLRGKRTHLKTLIDTGSPVSFIKFSIYCKFLKSASVNLSPLEY